MQQITGACPQLSSRGAGVLMGLCTPERYSSKVVELTYQGIMWNSYTVSVHHSE
jgi:hypothetical protein